MSISHAKGKHEAPREKSSGLSTIKKVSAIFAVAGICSVSVLSAASVSRVAYITDGDLTYTVTTTDTDTEDIVQGAGLELGEYDEAIVTEESSERIDINILRAFTVSITADGETTQVQLTSGTAADALEEADISYTANDFITPELTEELDEYTEITIMRAVKVYLTCDGTTNIAFVPEGTVGEALDYMGYQLSEDDELSVDADSEVERGMTISVDRVEYKTVYEKSDIEYSTIEEADATLEAGTTKVQQNGVNGILQVTIEEKYVNGKLKSSEQVAEEVLSEAVNEIILVGTKQAETSSEDTTSSEAQEAAAAAQTSSDSSSAASSSLDSSSSSSSESTDGDNDSTATLGTLPDGSSLTYSAIITGSATAYTSTSASDNITATGTVPQVGTVAVNPNIIPYGTKLYICSADGSYVYGYAVAEDTGGALMSGSAIVDLYMDTLEECTAFGRQDVIIYVLN